MTQDRDKLVRAIMREGFARAAKGDYQISSRNQASIEVLFSTSTWGFREVVLVVVIARLLDSKYTASSHFYDCNPRPLYEGPIRSVLTQKGIPRRKSGPLNVAKAAEGLNASWAAQRQPKVVADEVVRLVKQIERMSLGELRDFSAALHARFLQERQRVKALSVTAAPESDPQHLCELSWTLIDDVPDGGNTAQRVVGYLMEAYHEELQTQLVVVGHLDSAAVTSTTSKKPGDITEELRDGTVLMVYEVTTKSFGEQRVDESYDTLLRYGEASGTPVKEVVVICRDDDVHSDAVTGDEESAVYLGKLEHEDVTYHFVDIYEWVAGQLARMPADARLNFHAKLSEYVNEPNTSETVKKRWAKLAA